MTELQFLIDLLLKHKLPKETKKLVANRIGEVETRLCQPAIAVPAAVPIVGVRPPIQTAIRPDIEPPPSPMVAAPPIKIPVEIDKETGRPTVATGNGTRGPRKF